MAGKKQATGNGAKMIPIYIMGKKYEVPETLTILTAMEYAGYRHIRGCGCRGGICGACATVYRLSGEYGLKFGLACQTVVAPDMYLAQIPFVPANKAIYDIEKLTPDINSIGRVYPDLYRCLACNTCSKACPMGISVMDYVQALLKGDIAGCARLSHSCTMCGICALRCPAELQQFHMAMLARRLYGRYLQPRARHLEKRVKQIKEGKFDPMMDEIMSLNNHELKQRYARREWEPESYENPDWRPEETKYLVLD
ncbi:MAG: 4Fe-4S dicluster domain-containing protein [Desulfovibrionales bacterium]|nr:4Fe-4S dicluster domain-containing protein [Desulfovibrionales bacterium]